MQFQISTNHTVHRIVKVKVYDSVKELRHDTIAWDKKRGHDLTDLEKTYGICHKFEKQFRKRYGRKWYSHPYVAYIRLYKDGLRTGIITHECTHAAVWIYQLDRDLAKLDDIENEETMSYLVGDLSSKLVDKLYQYKLL